MAHRRLETALRASKSLQDSTPTFTQIEQQMKYIYGVERDNVYSLKFSHNGAKLAVGYGDGTIEILDTSVGHKSSTVRTGGARHLGVTVIRYHPKQEDLIVAGTSEGTVFMQVDNSSCRQLVHEPNNEINCLDFNQEGARFATAGSDLNVRVYDVETFKIITTYEGIRSMKPGCDLALGHCQRVYALKYHPDDVHVFITAGWDKIMRIWDARTRTGVQRTIRGPHISGDGLDIKGNHILTASWVQSNALQLWDYRKGCLLQDLPFAAVHEAWNELDGAGDHGDERLASNVRSAAGAYLYCAQFCTSDVVIAGGSGTKSVRVINRQSAQLLTEIKLEKSVFAIDSAKNGRLIATAGAGTRVLISAMS